MVNLLQVNVVSFIPWIKAGFLSRSSQGSCSSLGLYMCSVSSGPCPQFVYLLIC